MPGAVTQLALYGKEDALLVGEPEVTFFRLLYKRHTIFSMESIPQAHQSVPQFGRRSVMTITRSGDLVHTIFLEVDLPSLRDYAIDTVVSPQSAVPGLLSARYTTRTTGQVKVLPSTDGADARYDIYLDDGVSPVTIQGEAGVTDIPITGLDISKTYTVKVRRVNAGGTAGSWSADSMSVVSLRWCNTVGLALMRTVDLDIGGSRISRLTSEYMDAEAELTMPSEKEKGWNTMVGKFPEWDIYDNSLQERTKLFIPLTFSFCTEPGLSIPIVSLQFHQVQITYDFRDYTELIKCTSNVSSLVSASGRVPEATIQSYVTFIFLGTQERRRFSSGEKPLEYLHREVQFLGDTPIIVSSEEPSLQRKVSLDFSHPVSELIWTYNRQTSYNQSLVQSAYALSGNDYFNYDAPAGAEVDPIAKAVVHINGSARFSERSGSYFRLVQPYNHHTRIPDKKIYSYSFAIQAESSSPTGTLNFSRAQTAHLILTMDDSFSQGGSDGRVRIYAKTWNILRFSGGMAGLVFSSN
jgi:hypothetical protein